MPQVNELSWFKLSFSYLSMILFTLILFGTSFFKSVQSSPVKGLLFNLIFFF